MTRLIPDPNLEQLVRELNDSGDDVVDTSAVPSLAIAEGSLLEQLLVDMTQRNASDLLLIAGNPPIMRLAGRLVKTEGAPLEANEVASLFAPLVVGRVRAQLDASGATDFSLRMTSRRFRVNVHRQRGTLAAAIRSLPTEIPTLQQLNLPPQLAELVKPTRGLVLVCGPTGSGKTTTLAALVGEINRNEQRHIVTIEDPIEYEHRNQKSVIEQIEVGRDSPSFAEALRASLRQDPDVILVGEMRDLETVATALTAAETGHLILSTLHTSDAAQAIHRIIDVFPPSQQNQIKQQLALSLNAIVCQQLIPLRDGAARAVAVEVLMANYPVRNHIRNDKLQQLTTEITIAKRQGMISLEESLARLVREGQITIEDARIRAPRPDELDSLLR
jgi:twitching motility protein PilT